MLGLSRIDLIFLLVNILPTKRMLSTKIVEDIGWRPKRTWNEVAS